MHKKQVDYGISAEDAMGGNTMYLKFWDHDYPYLDGSRKDTANCLPVPVESRSQKHLYDTYISRKII